MKAILTERFGGPEVLTLGETDAPTPAAGQVLIKVMTTSINRPDIVQRQGKYPPPPGDSEILGLEVAGVVQEVGPEVSGWKTGDRVMGLVGGGGYAEYAVAYGRHLLPIPDTMGYEEAACVCETYTTAYLNVFLIGGLADGDGVLIHGGGGGVSTAAIQLCRALAPAAGVIVTAAPGKVGWVEDLGAHLVINYQERNFADEVRTFTKNRGVDVILDHIGADYLAPNMRSLAYGGRLVVIGVISGIKAELNLAVMMVKRQHIIGSVLRSRSIEEKGDIISAFKNTVLPRFADRTIVPRIHAVFPLEDAAAAHTVMEEDRHFGKIVLEVADG